MLESCSSRGNMLTDVDHKLENDIEFETDHHTISDVQVLIPDACSSLPVLVNRGFDFFILGWSECSANKVKMIKSDLPVR